jgi:hypothetical protein
MLNCQNFKQSETPLRIQVINQLCGLQCYNLYISEKTFNEIPRAILSLDQFVNKCLTRGFLGDFFQADGRVPYPSDIENCITDSVDPVVYGFGFNLNLSAMKL